MLVLKEVYLRASGFLKPGTSLKKSEFEQMMYDKIDALDLNAALSDLRPFISDSAQIADWSKDMLRHFVEETHPI